MQSLHDDALWAMISSCNEWIGRTIRAAVLRPCVVSIGLTGLLTAAYSPAAALSFLGGTAVYHLAVWLL